MVNPKSIFVFSRAVLSINNLTVTHNETLLYTETLHQSIIG